MDIDIHAYVQNRRLFSGYPRPEVHFCYSEPSPWAPEELGACSDAREGIGAGGAPRAATCGRLKQSPRVPENGLRPGELPLGTGGLRFVAARPLSTEARSMERGF